MGCVSLSAGCDQTETHVDDPSGDTGGLGIDATGSADAADTTSDTTADANDLADSAGADTGQPAIAYVELSPDDPTVERYTSLELEARALAEDGSEITGDPASWSSSAPETVGVNRFGTITGDALGTATVTATIDGVSAGVFVTVVGKPVGSVEVVPDDRTLQIGEQVTLSVFLENTAGAPIDEQRLVEFTSSDSAVAVVSDDGVVTGLSPGEATITATSEGQSASANIIVEAPATTTVDHITVDPAYRQFVRSDGLQFDATVVDTNGDPVADPDITWRSSAPAVATVDADGIVLSVGEGSAQILALSGGKTGTADVDVTFAVDAIDTGGQHSCALILGRAYCWGANDHGQLGHGDQSGPLTLGAVSAGHTFDDIAVGQAHSCGLADTGDVYCWGNNDHGQLGDAANGDQTNPVAVGGNHTFVELSANADSTCAVDDQQNAWCWGNNDHGQLGDATTADSNVPVAVDTTESIAHVVVGDGHGCALTTADQAICWGNNDHGQLGANDTAAHASPQTVTGGYSFAELAVGQAHTCGLGTDGTVACWGNNDHGQLGDGTTQPRSTPVLASAPTTFSTITAGAAHTCAIGQGDVYCWGNNNAGQLGLGADADRPTAVATSAQLRAVGAGADATCAVDTDGDPLCWGTVTSTPTPAPVAGF